MMKRVLVAVAFLGLLLTVNLAFAEAQEQEEPFRFNLYLEHVDLSDALRVIGEVSGLRIEMPSDIEELVTVGLQNVTATEALDAMLPPLNLKYTIDNQLIRIERQ